MPTPTAGGKERAPSEGMVHQPLSDLGLLLDALSSEHEAPQIKGSSSKRDAALAALLRAAESAANGPPDQSVETTIGGLTNTAPAAILGRCCSARLPRCLGNGAWWT